MFKTIFGNILETVTFVRTFERKRISYMTQTKTKRIDLRASEMDEKNLIAAAKKLGTEKISETIFTAVETAASSEEFLVDRSGIRKVDELIKQSSTLLQAFVTELRAAIGIEINFVELQDVLSGIGKLGSKVIVERAIEEFVRRKLHDKLISKYPDMIVTESNIPAQDLSKLFAIAHDLDSILPLTPGGQEIIPWYAFELSEGAISVVIGGVETLKSRFRMTAEGPQELKRLAKVKKLCAALNEIMDDDDAKIPPDKVSMLYFFDHESRRFEPTGIYIKNSINT